MEKVIETQTRGWSPDQTHREQEYTETKYLNMKQLRKSSMDIGEIYFYTSTIKDWKKLLKPDKFKDIIIEILKYLVDKICNYAQPYPSNLATTKNERKRISRF